MKDDKYELKQVQVRLKLTEKEPLYSTEPMEDPASAANVMAEAMSQLDREFCCVVNLDTRLIPINFNVVSIGGINSAEVPVQNVFKAAILSNAASVMLLHNHPSGQVEPSRDDRLLTARLLEAGKLMGIPVVDHIIIGCGNDSRYSFRSEEEGLFSEPSVKYNSRAMENKKSVLSRLTIEPEKKTNTKAGDRLGREER